MTLLYDKEVYDNYSMTEVYENIIVRYRSMIILLYDTEVYANTTV